MGDSAPSRKPEQAKNLASQAQSAEGLASLARPGKNLASQTKPAKKASSPAKSPKGSAAPGKTKVFRAAVKSPKKSAASTNSPRGFGGPVAAARVPVAVSRPARTTSSALTGVRYSLTERVNRWLAGSLERLSDEEVLKLVEAQSAAETVAELLVATPSARGTGESGWTELLLRGAEAKNRIATLAGGLLSPSEAARVLKISVPGVKQRLERGKLLAVPLPGGQRGFPARQFREDGRVRAGVAEVAAAGAGMDAWALLALLVDEAEDAIGGTLLERLADEAVRADVLSRLAGYGEHVAT
jgi:hypothetical protein